MSKEGALNIVRLIKFSKPALHEKGVQHLDIQQKRTNETVVQLRRSTHNILKYVTSVNSKNKWHTSQGETRGRLINNY